MNCSVGTLALNYRSGTGTAVRHNNIEQLDKSVTNWQNKNRWSPYSDNPNQVEFQWLGGPVYIEPAALDLTVNKIKGPEDWRKRTNDGSRFVYTYSAGCWTKLAPENYGYDVPEKFLTQFENDGTFSENKVAKYREAHKERDEAGIPQKYEINQALRKWWDNSYNTVNGTRYYFSLKDAITQHRCNGDEMLWYLFYSRPSQIRTYCEKTLFGNKIPKDFCKNNPPENWEWKITPKNQKERGQSINYEPSENFIAKTFGKSWYFHGFSKGESYAWGKASPGHKDFEEDGGGSGSTATHPYMSSILLLCAFIARS